MFETVNPAVRRIPRKQAFVAAISLSLVTHIAAIVGVTLSNVWQVSFPDVSPPTMISFAIAAAPSPPPPPPPPRKAPEQQQVVEKLRPQLVVAPSVIPDDIPVVLPQTVEASLSDAAVPQGVEGGVDEGEIGGQAGGVVGGVVLDTAPAVISAPVPDVVEIARDKPLPMYPLSQVYPLYPERARIRLWEDDLVVRYRIGKDGRVKSVEVIRPPQHDIFIDSTLRAIRSWRFKPMIKNGERVEVQHELTVLFRLEQVAWSAGQAHHQTA